MVTSSPCSIDEVVELAAQLLEGDDPQLQDRLPLGSQRVGAFRGTGQVAAPLRRDEPFVLQRTELSVDIPDVDALLTDDLGKPFQELVPVGRAVSKQHEQPRLAEALDARPHLPGAVVEAATVSRSLSAVAMHASSICNLHM
jgi:hypothetical protein